MRCTDLARHSCLLLLGIKLAQLFNVIAERLEAVLDVSGVVGGDAESGRSHRNEGWCFGFDRRNDRAHTRELVKCLASLRQCPLQVDAECAVRQIRNASGNSRAYFSPRAPSFTTASVAFR